MAYRPTFAAVVVVLSMLASGAAAAEPEPPGRHHYLRYCGACHGPEAKGDGLAGSLMRIRPPDLTLLASRHGGEFPLEQVVRTIDGREAPHAHGTPEMPVWGERLGEELGGGTKSVGVERRVQGRILSIAEYLRTIQAK
jgi:mono/diheme cytochrome c family protein